jgi:undecaprenyl-diphosphatase
MSILDAIILGLIEGITEYIPVSSTGHLILASSFLGLQSPEPNPAVDTFIIVVQGGAILAVLGLYRASVWRMIRGLLGKDQQGLRLFKNLFIAFLPAAVLGVAFNDFIEARLFHPGPVMLALGLGGFWMIWLGRKPVVKESQSPATTLESLPWTKALGIGLFQVVAMWPGTSRSMMTIAGGTLLGMKPKDAAEFSFLLGLPTLGGACVYSLGKNVLAARQNQEVLFTEQLGLIPVLVGIAVAAIAAALAVRWLVRFLTTHGLAVFGWYRLGLCVVMGILWMTGIIQFV